ncbi:MAG TPA: amino acid permease [Candidatus Angelobacter sp.]|nr:amino acid permease [Candidatus Angelobacter sp.]
MKSAEQLSHNSIGADSQDLARLGYAQELLRTIGGFSNFALSFSIISILTGAVTLFDYGLSMGGPLEMTLGWPLVTVGTLLVALSMAELSSAIPTSGAMYHWSAELGGPTWAWFTAWFNIIGLITVIVGIDYGCARFLVPILGLPSKHSTILLVYGLILLSHGLINHYGVRWVVRLNDVSVAVHILGVVILMAALWFFAPKQPLAFLLKASPVDPPVHAPYPWLFVLGLLQAQWTYTGFDGSAHVAEETVDPRRRAPWGMIMAVVVSGFFGYLLVLSLAWVIPDLRQALTTTDASGNTIPAVLAIVQRTIGERAGAAALGLTVLAMWFCGMASVTSLSRTFYAFSRDKGMPLWRHWSRIGVRQTPARAIWLSVILAFVALIYSGAYSTVTSISVVGFYISYIIPVYLGWRKKQQWLAHRGPWHLGQWSNTINLLAITWTVFICVIMVMPPNRRAGYTIAVVIVALFLLHLFSGKHEMRKPSWNLIQTDQGSDG